MNEAYMNLLERRSIRKYDDRPVPDALLDAVLQAGIHAPSGMNTQGVRLVAVRDPETVAYLSKLNAAVMNAAHALGLGSCWIHRAKQVFDSPEGKALLEKWGLPTHLRGVGNCILGYPACDHPIPAPRKDGRIVKIG